MIAAENLDHQPQTVTLERLPDGTALLWLRKDIRQTTPQDETAPGWECSLVTVHLTAGQAARETVESVQANFDTWWNYAPPTPEPTRLLEEALELLNDWEDMAAEEPDGYAGRRAALQAGYDAERRGL